MKIVEKKERTVIKGREVKYQIEGGFHRWKWQHRATITDIKTGLSGESDRKTKSKDGALERAIDDLWRKLEASGHLNPPVSSTPPIIPPAVPPVLHPAIPPTITPSSTPALNPITNPTTTVGGAQPIPKQLIDEEPIMSDLATQLYPLKAKWRAIGGQLGIEGYELDSIGRDQSLDDSDKLSRVFQLWNNKRTTEVSWRKILEVIRNPPIENAKVCKQIELFLGIKPVENNKPAETVTQPQHSEEVASLKVNQENNRDDGMDEF